MRIASHALPLVGRALTARLRFQWQALGSPGPGLTTLGQAGPLSIISSAEPWASNCPLPIANNLAGVRRPRLQDPSTAAYTTPQSYVLTAQYDIQAQFNNAVNWYYGTVRFHSSIPPQSLILAPGRQHARQSV